MIPLRQKRHKPKESDQKITHSHFCLPLNVLVDIGSHTGCLFHHVEHGNL